MNFSTENTKEIIKFPIGQEVKGNRLTKVALLPPAGKAGHSIVFEFTHLPRVKNDEGNLIYDEKNESYGAKLQHRLFSPNLSQPADKLQKSINQVMSSIKHIVGAVIDQSVFNVDTIKADNFEDYAKKLVEEMSKYKYQDVSCTLMVGYNKQNYASLPSYPDYISTSIKPKKFDPDPNYVFFNKREIAPSGIPGMPMANSLPSMPSMGTEGMDFLTEFSGNTEDIF